MKTIFLSLVILFFALQTAAQERFFFHAPLKEGSSFQCRIMTDQIMRYSFLLRGREQPLVREETLKGSFSGYLQILAADKKGNARRLRLRMDLAHGILNGRVLKITAEKGVLIQADLSGRESVFCREDRKKLSRDEITLLQALFRPPSGGRLSDYLGKERILPAPGRNLPLNTDHFLESLANRQIRLNRNSLRGSVIYQGKAQVGKRSCREFRLILETTSLKEYDFRLKAALFLENKSPVPLRMKREAREVLLRTLPGNDPFSAGAKVELRSMDNTEQTMLPVSGFPAATPGRGRSRSPSGRWDSLLR